MRVITKIKIYCICLASIALIGCGSGGSDGGIEGSGQTTSLKGTVAVGAPLANTVIVIKDLNGVKKAAITDINGNYKIEIEDDDKNPLSPPFIIRAGEATQDYLYSIYHKSVTKSEDQVANVHPYSNIIVRNFYSLNNRDIDTEFDSPDPIPNPPSTATIETIVTSYQSIISATFSDFEVATDFNLITSEFTADHTGFDKLLDNSTITITNNQISIKVKEPTTNLETNLITNLDLATDITQTDTDTPTIPSNLRASTIGDGKIKVSWFSAIDNIAVTGYKLFRDDVEIATTPYTIFEDSGLVDGTEYCYSVLSVDSSANPSAQTDKVCETATTEAIQNEKPNAPSNVASIVEGDNIIISWAQPEESTQSAGILGFNIYRKKENETDEVKIATIGTSNLSDDLVVADQQYCYVIKTIDFNGIESDASTQSCAMISLPDKTAPVTFINPIAGTYTTPKTISLTCNDNSSSGCQSTYYTLDGTEPTVDSAQYTTPIVISQTSTIKYYSIDTNGNVEDVETKQFDINLNNRPTSDAGADIDAEIGVQVQLDGNQSRDDDAGDVITFLWNMVSKPADSAASLDDTTLASPAFTPDKSGSYVFSLFVNDGLLDSDFDTVVVNIPVISEIDQNDPVTFINPTPGNYSNPQNISLTCFDNGGTGCDATYYTINGDTPTSSSTRYTQPFVVNATTTVNYYSVDKQGNEADVESKIFEININNNPVAKAGSDINTTPGSQVQLDGSGSFDDDLGDEISYQWSIVSLPVNSSASLDDTSSEKPNFNADEIGTYVFALTVNDQLGGTDLDTVVVNINEETDPATKPIADAGENITASIGSTIYLNGNQSTPVNVSDRLNYYWTFIKKPEGSNAIFNYSTIIDPIFMVDLSGTYKISLVVNDGYQDSDAHIIEITTDGFNSKPVAIAGNNQKVEMDETVILNGKASYDAQTKNLTYLWELLESPIDSTAALDNTFSETPTFIADKGGRYKIKLVVSDGELDSVADIVYVHATVVSDELEPNNVREQAQNFTQIGLNYPIRAHNSAGNDQDWYRFEAIANETYVIDLFDVDASLAVSASSSCTNANYKGLFLIATDASQNEIGRQCQPVGAGNVHTILTIKPTETGTHYIQVASNYFAGSASGDYSIRVLPQHDSENASWDAQTLEPNNHASIAYEMQLGAANAVRTKFEERRIPFATNRSDLDWYHFEAVANEIYIIELFDVDASLATIASSSCTNANYKGLYLVATDASLNEIDRQCQPVGAGNVHTILTIKPTEAGTVYIQVASNYLAGQDNGDYSIRILPQHDDINSTWSTETFEPNNRAGSAYELQLGAANAVRTNLEERRTPFSTNRADVDWFRFEAIADETYVIELFDVDASLATIASSSCTNANYKGLFLITTDASENEIGRQCKPVGAGNVHTILTIEPTETGTVYVQVASNYLAGFDNGDYSIRILPQHDDVSASWDAETLEPNNQASNAYELQLGAANAISSKFEERRTSFTTNRADVDWYRFEAIADETYVVELFDVGASLATVASTSCTNANYKGLFLVTTDASENEIARQCKPIGAGNVHTILAIEPTETGTVYIQVASNYMAGSDSGEYSIRVLPQHNEISASWDAETFEPNNRVSNAYEIELGLDYESNISTRNSVFSTNRADMDWYRFEAVANETYVIELFDVDASLSVTASTGCTNANYTGLFLVILDTELSELERQCRPTGTDIIHNMIQVTPSVDGTHYIQVAPNFFSGNESGNYRIRINTIN